MSHPERLKRLYGYEGKRWVCYFWYHGIGISLGIHICWHNIEIHLPLGFIRIGRRYKSYEKHPPYWNWGGK